MKRSFECTCSYDQDLQTEKAAGVYFHRVPSPPMLPTVEEAQRFYNELEERLQKFGLELARDKTRVIRFSRTNTAAVAQSAQSAAQLYLDRLQRTDVPAPTRTTTHRANGLSKHSSLAAEASIHEEPGAGKPHAGICAGTVGQLAVLPQSTCFLARSGDWQVEFWL